jgi:hypothetical protein
MHPLFRSFPHLLLKLVNLGAVASLAVIVDVSLNRDHPVNVATVDGDRNMRARARAIIALVALITAATKIHRQGEKMFR